MLDALDVLDADGATSVDARQRACGRGRGSPPAAGFAAVSPRGAHTAHARASAPPLHACDSRPRRRGTARIAAMTAIATHDAARAVSRSSFKRLKLRDRSAHAFDEAQNDRRSTRAPPKRCRAARRTSPARSPSPRAVPSSVLHRRRR
ncbi:hypothetical protein OSB53_12155 [Burkholderia pseudomallei]|nr:hypothetical protein [Burkholderia pseudomallei]UZU13815.1 hypothetical protein OSB53_12155 [Burkholderia pseudomallei]UZU21806.1 hypothetical protein OSB35_22050 [Burkholderia pseudomallei]UZU30871.1 hypothetical protein OSB54_21435 [Burkholderia pseudomallei]